MRFRSISIGILCLCLLAGAASAAVEVETVNVSALRSENSPPVAQNLSLDTYRGVSVGGTFQAVDPEGDLLSFRITSEPGKGTVTVDGRSFVYTPAPNKRGRDRFTYQAVDAAGSASPDAEVSIRIGKQSTDVFYPELSGTGLQYAALRLAEEGIFTGERIGLCYDFSQEMTLSRGDFLTMCAALTGMEPLEDVTRTGFYDDESIPVWQKPYVSAALLYGLVQGSTGPEGQVFFRGEAPITRAEAAVMLNDFLELSDTAGIFYREDVPGWAAQAVANLYSSDICSGDEFRASGSLTRGEAAEMLSSALDVLRSRGKNRSFSWNS